MNGAQALINTLVDGGVDVCFANPGTSEMHFVAALDTCPACAACWPCSRAWPPARPTAMPASPDRPAAVLLHLGPGLGNGLANLHNARRARVPMVVVVGDHATYHKKYDAPLESDIDALAGTVSGWVRRTGAVADVAADAAEAIAASRSGSQISTLILPADVSWSDGAQPAPALPARAGGCGPAAGARGAGGAALGGAHGAHDRWGRHPRARAGRGRADRGGDRGPVACVRHSRRGSSAAPACPPSNGSATSPRPPRPSWTAPSTWCWPAPSRRCRSSPTRACPATWCRPAARCTCSPNTAVPQTRLAALADELAPGTAAPVAAASRPQLPTGALTSASAADVIGALLPERAIVVDESNTSGLLLLPATAGAPAHDWLTLTGGAIGYGIPTAVGAAVAAPDRPVLCLESDGSAMYTISGLWTQARENLNVTTVLYNNSAYDILRIELQRVGAGSAPGPEGAGSARLVPSHNGFRQDRRGHGGSGAACAHRRGVRRRAARAFAEPGPHLIDAVVPSLMG